MLMDINNIWRMFHLTLPVIPERRMTKCMHYNDVRMSAMASQVTSLTTVDSTVHSRRRSNMTPKPRVTGLCAGNSPVTGAFPTQRASNAENVSIWWRHHGLADITGTNTGVWNVYSLVVLNVACSIFPHNEPRNRRCYHQPEPHELSCSQYLYGGRRVMESGWVALTRNHNIPQSSGYGRNDNRNKYIWRILRTYKSLWKHTRLLCCLTWVTLGKGFL